MSNATWSRYFILEVDTNH